MSAEQILVMVCHAEYFAPCQAVFPRLSCKVIVNMQFKVFGAHVAVLQNVGNECKYSAETTAGKICIGTRSWRSRRRSRSRRRRRRRRRKRRRRI